MEQPLENFEEPVGKFEEPVGKFEEPVGNFEEPVENYKEPVENFEEQGMDEVGRKTNNDNLEHGGDLEIDDGAKKWPGWPGENVFRILVPSQKVGGIIGRKGEFIKKMCEESRARIKILDGPHGAQERAVMISAKEEQDASVSPAMDGLLKVHKRLIDGLENDSTSLAPPNMVFTRLLVPATQAGSLIGKQGATIKIIQEESNCILRILEDVPPVALQDDRVVEIQGEPINVHKAVELISSHLRKFLVDRSVVQLLEIQMQTPHHPRTNQNIPPPQPWGPPQGPPPNIGGSGYSSNLGYGGNPSYESNQGYGSNSMYGGNQGYGGNVNYGGNASYGSNNPNYGGDANYGGNNPNYGGNNRNYGGNDPNYENPPYMPPTHPHDNYYAPPTEVPPPFEKPPHQGISTYGREAPQHGTPLSASEQPSSNASQTMQRLQVPLSYADAVIGNAGANISYIRRISGATVTIHETRGVPGEMTVEITGTATQVQIAQQLTQNYMAEAAGANTVPATTAPQNPTGPADQGYNSYPPVYAAPPTAASAGLPAQPPGGYGSTYGAYGY